MGKKIISLKKHSCSDQAAKIQRCLCKAENTFSLIGLSNSNHQFQFGNTGKDSPLHLWHQLKSPFSVSPFNNPCSSPKGIK